ncbi:MAG TPA: VCBS repeat-containing protein [Candidatus Sulfomarinibacteraceae bacterium]|nr:VCBS repeat-containing protein [Candidatus Sulfomarinibacteraceae bacterium]
MTRVARVLSVLLAVATAAALPAAEVAVEISEDGLEAARPIPREAPSAWRMGDDVPYPLTADWTAALRVQVGGLAVADVDGDGDNDLVVGCYHSDSYPPYPDWENLIYLNTGSGLEATPSWVSSDERSTGDIQVGFIDDDPYLDVFAANGGFEMAPSVIYFGSASGPSTTPGWFAADSSWTNYAALFDLDHDGDLDVATANQGNSPTDPYRPMVLYSNDAGTLATSPSWLSAETSIQNFLAWGDLDGDGWEDLAVSKWANFSSGVYRNVAGSLATTPTWTTGTTDTDKGVGWADVDGDSDPDLALGHDPTQLWTNTAGSLTVTWTSTAAFHGHSDLRWHDVDLDGDPDLAEVHFSNGQAHIYLNRGGVLDSAPSWTFDSPHVGTAIAFGDINGDSLPDLAVGNSGDTSLWVFYNTGTAVLFADDFESGGTGSWSVTVP